MNKLNFKDLIILLPITSLFITTYDWFLGYSARLSQPVVTTGLVLAVTSILLAIFTLNKFKKAGVITLALTSIALTFVTGFYLLRTPVLASFECKNRDFVIVHSIKPGEIIYLNEGFIYTNMGSTRLSNDAPSEFIQFDAEPSKDLKSDLQSCFDFEVLGPSNQS